MAGFAKATSLRALGASSHAESPSGDGRYACDVDGEWVLPTGSPHGGYVGALLLRAVLEWAGEEGRRTRSITVHYLRPPKVAPAEIEVHTINRGRSATFVQARLVQDGKLHAQATAVLAADRGGEFVIDPPPKPSVPPPASTPPSADFEAFRPDFSRHFEMLPTFDLPFSGAERAICGGWTRSAEELPIDEPLVFVIMDLWFPAPWAVADRLVPAPTIDLTVHFTDTIEPSPADRFLLLRMDTPQVKDGYFCEDAELWTPDGRLVAQSRQLALAIDL